MTEQLHLSTTKSKPGIGYFIFLLVLYSVPIVFFIFLFIGSNTKISHVLGAFIYSTLAFLLTSDLYEIDSEKITFHKLYFFKNPRWKIYFSEIQKIENVPVRGKILLGYNGTSIFVQVKGKTLVKIIHLPLFSNHLELRKAMVNGMDLINQRDRVSPRVLAESTEYQRLSNQPRA
jgi:hypothetical protein